MLADHAGRNAEPRRSASEAGALHHLGEDPHIVEAVQRGSPIAKRSQTVYAAANALSRTALQITLIGQPCDRAESRSQPLWGWKRRRCHMQSLGKSMVARERDAIKIGIAQCSLAEL